MSVSSVRGSTTDVFFFCDFYSREELGKAEDFGCRVRDCLQRQLQLVGQAEERETELAICGRVEEGVTCRGRPVWLYRIFFALPRDVKWVNLWQKVLGDVRTAEGDPVVLGRDKEVRDYMMVWTWNDEYGASFVDFWHACQRAVQHGLDGKPATLGSFGDEKSGVRSWQSGSERDVARDDWTIREGEEV